MIDFEPFLQQVDAVILATWPEVATGGCWPAEFISRVPWLDLTLPFAVVLIPEWPRTYEWGMANLTFRPVLSIYYVAETAGAAVALRGKLADLVNALSPHDPLKAAHVGQVELIGDISVGDDLAPNQLFAAANRSQRAGLLQITCLMGVTRP